MKNKWYAYIVRCCDGVYYTGITKNVEKRVRVHNSGKGAAFTSGRRPVQLVYSEGLPDKSDALKREFQIKSLRRDEKESLIRSRLNLQ